MGSHDFGNIYRGTGTVEEAYRDVVDEALSMHGHDPYNGTISTTSGVRLVPVKPMNLADAEELASSRIDKLSKWDTCEAIPLVAETEPEYEILPEQEAYFGVTGAVYNDQAQLALAARKALGMNANIEITEVALKVERPSFNRMATVEKRVVAEVPKEPAETRYFILTKLGRMRGEDMDWDKGYPTQAAARAALDTVLRYDYHGIPAVEAEIIGLTRRVSGAALVKATVSAKKVTGTFVVKTRRMVKPATFGTERAGYYFYGWAAS